MKTVVAPGVPAPGQTSRLLIEVLPAAHAHALHAVLDDARIYRYIEMRRFATPAALLAEFARLVLGPGGLATDTWLNWALRERSSARYLGTLQATVSAGNSAWIGYLLAPSAWGHGFAQEACRWLVARLARDYGIKTVRASVDARNLDSIRLVRRLGFVHESTEPCELHGVPAIDHHYRLDIRSWLAP